MEIYTDKYMRPHTFLRAEALYDANHDRNVNVKVWACNGCQAKLWTTTGEVRIRVLLTHVHPDPGCAQWNENERLHGAMKYVGFLFILCG